MSFLRAYGEDFGRLWLRLGFGGFMLFAHGLGKVLNFGERADKFADPLGLGPQLSMLATIGTEVVCSLAVIIGFKTRWAALPLVFTMAVVAGIVHADDPWGKKELALVYLVGFGAIALLGPGRFSLDQRR